MKKFLSIAFVFLTWIDATAQGQEYIPMLNQTNHWDVATMSGVSICWYLDAYRFKIQGDTIINGNTLLTFIRHPFQTANGEPPFCPPFEVANSSFPSSYYLLEDTVNQKVYRYVNDSLEIIYDFTLEVGDFFGEDLGGSSEAYELLAIDTVVYLDGIPRRRFEFDYSTDGPGTMVYVEGMGGTQGLFNPFSYSISEYDHLMCFSRNDSIVFDDTQCSPWATEITEFQSQGINVWYSNKEQSLILESNIDYGPVEIRMSDVLGKVLHTIPIFISSGEMELPISPHSTGLHVVSILSDGVEVSRRKVVLE